MARKPQITLSSLDLDRIEALLAAIPASVFPGKADLQAELDRADVVAPEEIPPNVVTMNSTVQFTIEETGKEFCLTLVYPRDMDGSADRISIFAPVGSALLGLAVGDACTQTPEKLYIYKGYPLSSSGTPDAVFLSSNNI